MSRWFSTVGVLSCGLVSVTAMAEGKVTPLAEMRGKLVLPAYTASDKKLLLDQADLLMRELFVHRDLKIKDFGAQADPLPKLEKIRSGLGELTADGFHLAMANVFQGLHDLHTTYSAPRPLACGVAFLPIRFELVKEGGWHVLASRRTPYGAEFAKDIALGDELLEINGQATLAELKTLTPLSGGSNGEAMRSRSVQLLSFRNLANQPLPAVDSLKLKFRGDSGTYEKELPWLTLSDDRCFGEVDENEGDFFLQTKIGLDEFQHRFNAVFSPEATPSRDTTMEEALKEIFEASAIETPAGTFGYIRLKTFLWRDKRLDLTTIVDGMRRAVEDRLEAAQGLVIDVRGNGGGHIVLAEKMVQLFSPQRVKPTTVRMLANELNEKVFLKANGGPNRWSDAVAKAMQAGRKYTAPLAITPPREANEFGQVWYRPVVVLTDANCYSACDLFAGGMQDNDAAVIVGTHKTTGGGGANVMEYGTFRAVLGNDPANPFLLLPHDQSMRVSWRQTLRAGKSDGVPIEDLGIQSDKVVPLTKGDIGAESHELMRTIHGIIDELAPRYTSGVSVKTGGHVLLANGDEAKWTEEVWGVDTISIESDSRTLGEWEVEFSPEAAEVELAVQGLTGEWSDHRVVLVGKKGGKNVFRVVRELAWRGLYEAIPEAGLAVDPQGEKIAPLHNVVLKGDADAAWREVGGRLRVGAGPLYPNDSLVRAFLPVQLDGKGGTLSMEIQLEAEDINDGLRLFALNPDTGERRNYFAGSRIPNARRVTLPLPKEWPRADIVFEFESDENWNLTGPAIRGLTVEKSVR